MTVLADGVRADLARTTAATLSTQMFKRGFRNVWMRGVRPLIALPGPMIGFAVTLRMIPAREDIDVMASLAAPDNPQRNTIETIPAGAVLVVDCGGDASAASAGDILVARMRVRGAAGLVTDGGIRDVAPTAALGFPVFLGGPAAPLNLARFHAAEANVPVACGGVAVYPGDILVGDADGVVVLPAHLAAEVARDAAEQEALEVFLKDRILAGAPLAGTYPPSAETRAAWEARARSPDAR